MTYKELYEKAMWLLEHNEINGKEYDKMIEPLNAEVGNAEPVRHGEWIGGDLGYCTACGHEGCASDIWDGCTGMYCPNCGAKMDGERKE